MTDTIVNQILAIRSTGATNLFLWRNVLEIAEACGFEELAAWLPEHVKVYSNFILTGRREL